MLLDRPLAYAPYDPSKPTENPHAVYGAQPACCVPAARRMAGRMPAANPPASRMPHPLLQAGSRSTLSRPVASAPHPLALVPPTTSANSLPGVRGFSDPQLIPGGDAAPETVGTWVAAWNWVPCQGWSHAKCADMMRSVGYRNARVPAPTPGEAPLRKRARASAHAHECKCACVRRHWHMCGPRALLAGVHDT